MRLSGSRDPLKFNTAGCIILPAALFIGIMLAGPGTAIWPKMAWPGAAIVCGGGEVAYESYGASYRPGEYTVSRMLYCQTGEGKTATREEITFGAIAVSFLIYSAILFLLLQFVARPILARRMTRGRSTMTGGPAMFAGPAPREASDQPVELGAILARVSEAVQRGAANVTVRNVTVDADAGGGDVAARLTQLKALRDQGLITAEDYEAKKAEILAGL